MKVVTVHMAKKACQWRRPFGILSKVIDYIIQLSILRPLAEIIWLTLYVRKLCRAVR